MNHKSQRSREKERKKDQGRPLKEWLAVKLDVPADVMGDGDRKSVV